MSQERMSAAQQRAVEQLAKPGSKLKWDGDGSGYIIPGWNKVFAGTAKNLQRRKLLKRIDTKKDALGFYGYVLRKRTALLTCATCGERKPDDEFARSQKKSRRGRADNCRECDRLRKQGRNGKDAPDLRTPQQKYSEARERLDPGPHPDVLAQYEALRL